jgi:hypothetical protein
VTIYRSRVKLPDVVTDFINAFTGPGAIEILDGSFATFTYEAEDLWEAAQIVHDVQVQTLSTYMQIPEISKPVEYVEPESEPRLKTYPEPWPATELDEMIERLEEIAEMSADEGWTAVQHKIQEALGRLGSAAEASRQYADGTLEPR